MNILLYGKGEIKVTAAIKVASQLTLRYRDYPPINLTQSGVDRMDRIFKGKM